MFSPTLFPEADYAHRLSVKRGDLRAFFAPTEEHKEIMAERRRWLGESPRDYVAAAPDAAPLIRETAQLLAPHVMKTADRENLTGLTSQVPSSRDLPVRDLIAIGCAIEPDIVLLKKGDDDVFRVVAGCVCFPSSWSLPEKLGLPLDQVHSIVPNLNTSIGAPISRFLAKMQPGAAWERSNWGLSAVADRNQHPSRKLPRLRPRLSADKVWLRVEDQILAILPETGVLLFGIRIVRATLTQTEAEQPEIIAGLHRALATMPEEMARYKNIAAVRSDVVKLLGRSGSVAATSGSQTGR